MSEIEWPANPKEGDIFSYTLSYIGLCCGALSVSCRRLVFHFSGMNCYVECLFAFLRI